MTFSEKLNELRAKKSMSQLELSFKAKIAREIVYRYCADKKEPLFYDVVKICEALDVDIKEFAGTTFKRPEKKEVQRMKCDDCPAAWAERDIMTACGVEHGEYGCYIQGMEYGGEGESCDLAKCEVERRLKELKLYARGEIKRPEWLLQRFLHDLTSQMDSVECHLPGFPPLWQSKREEIPFDDEYCITVKPLYGSTDMHYEVRGARRDVLEKVSEEIAFTKRNIKSENSEYLTGYLAALSGVEGLIAEVRANEGL